MKRWLNSNVSRFDAVHIHAVFSHPCLAAARACQKRGVPYVVRPLGSLDPWSMRQKASRKKLLWKLAGERMMKRAAAVHYTTREEQRLAESSLGLNNGVAIPLGVEPSGEAADRSLFRSTHKALGEAPYLLALSRIHPKKNFEMLIEAFASVVARDSFAAWRLVIAGDGEAGYTNSLRALANRNGVGARVLFVGWVDGDEKASALRGAELFVLPSHQENFGIAAAEALACGVPVLVSEHVNLAPDIERARAGWVAPVERKAFARTLERALSNAEDRSARGNAGKTLLRTKFSWNESTRLLIELYDSAASGSVALGLT
jgi:glycosyltransferase involved in cell wall biosynthesis